MPGNISPYSSGAPGASLTSTSVDPQTQNSQLLWDEVRKGTGFGYSSY
jgi:peptidyl-prolyl cis-trans isomerase-like protein 2